MFDLCSCWILLENFKISNFPCFVTFCCFRMDWKILNFLKTFTTGPGDEKTYPTENNQRAAIRKSKFQMTTASIAVQLPTRNPPQGKSPFQIYGMAEAISVQTLRILWGYGRSPKSLQLDSCMRDVFQTWWRRFLMLSGMDNSVVWGPVFPRCKTWLRHVLIWNRLRNRHRFVQEKELKACTATRVTVMM